VAEYNHWIEPSKASEDTDVTRMQIDSFKNSQKTSTQPTQAVTTSPGAADGAVPPSATGCDPTYPCYSTLLYSLETVVPLINLRQAEYWTLTANHIAARLIRGWLGISAILGWVLVTFTAGSALVARR
jgi:hypothetical protein